MTSASKEYPRKRTVPGRELAGRGETTAAHDIRDMFMQAKKQSISEDRPTASGSSKTQTHASSNPDVSVQKSRTEHNEADVKNSYLKACLNQTLNIRQYGTASRLLNFKDKYNWLTFLNNKLRCKVCQKVGRLGPSKTGLGYPKNGVTLKYLITAAVRQTNSARCERKCTCMTNLLVIRLQLISWKMQRRRKWRLFYVLHAYQYATQTKCMPIITLFVLHNAL